MKLSWLRSSVEAELVERDAVAAGGDGDVAGLNARAQAAAAGRRRAPAGRPSPAGLSGCRPTERQAHGRARPAAPSTKTTRHRASARRITSGLSRSCLTCLRGELTGSRLVALRSFTGPIRPSGPEARRWFPRRSPADGRSLGWWRGSIRNSRTGMHPAAEKLQSQARPPRPALRSVSCDPWQIEPVARGLPPDAAQASSATDRSTRSRSVAIRIGPADPRHAVRPMRRRTPRR